MEQVASHTKVVGQCGIFAKARSNENINAIVEYLVKSKELWENRSAPVAWGLWITNHYHP